MIRIHVGMFMTFQFQGEQLTNIVHLKVANWKQLGPKTF